MSQPQIHYALRRGEGSAVGVFSCLDPTRKTRADALSAEIVAQVQHGWELFTQASPDLKPLARLKTETGWVEHPIHHLMDDVSVVYERTCDMFGKLCGKTKFNELRPYFVHKATYNHALCPYCYAMRLLLDAFIVLIAFVKRKAHKCACKFCAYWRQEKNVAHTSFRKRIALCLCEKQPAPAGFHICW